MDVPVIDVSAFVQEQDRDAPRTADAERIGAEVDRACREVGFFSVVGHGVDEAVVDSAYREAMAFFDLAMPDRLSVARPEAGYPYGYNPFSAEALNRSIGGDAPPDLKETFNVGPIDAPKLDGVVDADQRAIYAPNLWPAARPALRPAIEAYYRSMSELASTLMRVFAVSLGLDDDWFDPFVDRHPSALRLAHYPALASAPPIGSQRAGAHTDYGTLTILRLDDEPGLQVESLDDEWVDVKAPQGALVVNLGDLMQRWTNDRWRSTMHRVVVPDGGSGRRRLTMPFFHNANWDAVVECIVGDGESPRHEPVTAGGHLMAKFRSTVT
ncbi:MAG: 2-oxoglutarate and iron-dependent oxygenase domain-containing protein [Ilumatobacter sp.]|uniref:isopenicillin N synthase family dioxygenase n=1 Tax=Ilumatobacter sp. TaxID=1967498 RepID=UPI003C72941A